MGKSKEQSENVRKKILKAHAGGKGYKSIANQFHVPVTTIRRTVMRWKQFGTAYYLPHTG